jgi:uncharacterized protein YifE (UPF0438 family)
LRIEAYHSQINNRKEEEKQHIKISEKSTRTTGKHKEKWLFYLKKEKRKRLHIINTVNSQKIERLKCKSDQN